MSVYRSLRRWFYIAGSLIGLVGVVFVVQRLAAYGQHIDLSHFDIIAWSIIALLVLVYGAANILLASAWWYLLVFFEVKVHWGWTVEAYGLSQLAKYVPGNIFHLAGRQALGMAAGLPVRPLAKSALWELGLQAIAGALFAILAIPLAWPKLSPFMSVVLFLVITGIVFVALRCLFSTAVAAALAWQTTFLVVSGTMFIGVLSIVAPSSVGSPALSTLCGAYVLAWLAGLVTLGAPGGIGVREMVLLFLLGGQIGQAELLIAVALGRVVTVAGDLLFFLTGMFWKHLYHKI